MKKKQPTKKSTKKLTKKIVKKVTKKIMNPVVKMGKPIGKVTHYYDHIKVGVIKLSSPLKEGDEIRIMGGEATDFNQVVKSMQMDHKEIKKAPKGKAIGLKVKEKVREGYKVYRA